MTKLYAIRKHFRDLPIYKKLVFSFVFLAIFPALFIGILSYCRSSELIKHKTEQYTNDILMEMGNNIENKLREAERVTFQVLSNSIIQNSLKKSNRGFANEQEKITAEKNIHSQLSGLISSVSDIAAIQIISNNGTIYYVNPASISLNDNEEERKIVEKGLGRPYWFNTDPSTQTLMVGRVINSLDAQKKIGYVFVYLRESSIINTFKETELFNNGKLYIIDQQGYIVLARDRNLLGKRNEFTSKAINGFMDNNTFTTAKIAGKNYYVSYRDIKGTSWKMVCFIPSLEYEWEVILLRNWIFLTILLCCLLSFVLSVVISKDISKPVQDLSKKMQEVGKGNFSVYIDYDAKDEIGVLSRRFNEMVSQVNLLIKKVYQEELLKQKAELKSLRMQINPHFLYNTLESINWMARMHGVPEIGRMVKALGDLMRASINGEDFISVREEIRNIENYLTIQKFRYGDKISAEMDINPGILDVKIPKLIFQPIVENAVIHGIENKIGNGKISIEGFSENGTVILRVKDDGIGMDEELCSKILSENHDSGKTDRHTHIGLKNVDKRIKMYYGEKYGIKIQSRKGCGTCVSISIPSNHTVNSSDS
ncbi:histidine kinase [Thermoclostridium stercorarium subsp. leptospartum DSM 9219]|uniref:histidine kinase n=1 Tax=Thermoclostridium stercorarium subsp. leptospartum DSM 9219 TaxID=1346611 RepID=A0A1B1YLC0_THEST|nr:sensor histidine kinase [Thermoclostridium stercorarium]ANX01543.1 histidine kinase [Thermoclostridium stercorarium subsp. leptospartum DSM 9219]